MFPGPGTGFAILRTMPRIRKAVFPAAGLGTRFLPATKAQPKEMLPLVDKPLIQYAVEEARDSGIDQILLVTGRGKNAIEDHFDVSFELETLLSERGKEALLAEVREISQMIEVAYVRQKQALGLGHAILQAKDLVGNEPFAVLLADDIIDSERPALRQMIDVFERRGNPVLALCEVPHADTAMYGIVSGTSLGDRLFAVSGMVEKPRPEDAPSRNAIIGRYILTPDIFPILEQTPPDHRGEIQITDALKTLLGRRPIDGYAFEGKRYDAGDKLGFLKATVELALKREDLGAEFREYLRALPL
jgi:UTP--glucose-1-phosphate uridylyltransferase